MARKFSCRIAIGLLFYIGMATTLITTPVYAAEKPEEAVARLLERLRTEFNNGYGSDEWAGVLRELILLGPDATPVLSKALDAEDDLRMLRCYGFVILEKTECICMGLSLGSYEVTIPFHVVAKR